eukprot:UC4_evm1s833
MDHHSAKTALRSHASLEHTKLDHHVEEVQTPDTAPVAQAGNTKTKMDHRSARNALRSHASLEHT